MPFDFTESAYIYAAFMSLCFLLTQILEKKSSYKTNVFLVPTAFSFATFIVSTHSSYLNIISPYDITLDLTRILLFNAAMYYICFRYYRLNQFSTFNWLHISVIILSSGVVLYSLATPLRASSSWYKYSGLLLALSSVALLEQTYRNTHHPKMPRAYSIFFTSLMVYEIIYFSLLVISTHYFSQLWQGKGIANGMVFTLLTLSFIISGRGSRTERPQLQLSRNVIYYSSSMIVSGIFICFLAVGGYYTYNHGGNWINVLYSVAVIGSVLVIGILLTSKRIRSRYKTLINKHFFEHKYDYRHEWLRLITQINEYDGEESVYKISASCLTRLFENSHVTIWGVRDKDYSLFHATSDNLVKRFEKVSIDHNSAFIEHLQSEWIFVPNASAQHAQHSHNATLPDKFLAQDVIFIAPLMVGSVCTGFITLHNSNEEMALSWEDFDIIKLICRQIASFIQINELSVQVVNNKQLEALHKFSAFMVHDLKNLIAQQDLVVHNAKKHKQNPEFVDDAFSTIEGSVLRMKGMLSRIGQNNFDLKEAIPIGEVINLVLERSHGFSPVPKLLIEDTNATVECIKDKLVSAITHLTKNAQEACDENGDVNIGVASVDNKVCITIKDTGSGMSLDFIANRLFKPFETTKSNKGMGIGVYQAKDYIQDIGGSLKVDSEPGAGSTFTVVLPLAGNNYDQTDIADR